MSNFLNKNLVLRLNRNWVPIGICTIKDALIAMCSGDDFLKAATAIAVEYPQGEGEDYDFDNPINFIPTPFNEWVGLEVRKFDLCIHTSKMAIRAPTILICNQYAKVPMIKPRPTRAAIRERDGGRCQVSGKILSRKGSTVDHLLPVSRGGKNTFKNLVLMDKELNSKKGDRTLKEMGWKLIKEPTEPLPIPVSATIKELKNRDWKHFLVK